jgi:hypothetical protein
MLLVQKYHSIHEIDPEFAPNLELLLQEDIPNIQTLIRKHDMAPATDVFTYFLFFASTQNTPIGFAQLCLRKIDSSKFLSLSQKLKFWEKDHLHWKELIWEAGQGSFGMCVFDPRHNRAGKEKMQTLVSEYDQRSDVKAQLHCSLKGLQDFKTSWEGFLKAQKDRFLLDVFSKAYSSYQTYLESLSESLQKEIKQSWKKLHKIDEIQLGDYSPLDAPPTIPIAEELLKSWDKEKAQILTFEKDLKILGCLVVFTGKNGNVFFEPLPFETGSEHLISEVLYIQYALLKFFEMSDARKCHLIKDGKKLSFSEKEEMIFYQEQGFQMKTLTQSFYSKIPELNSAQ